MWFFLLGAGVVAAFLGAIGITRNRLLDVRSWTAVWTGASLAFAALLLLAFFDHGTATMELALGGAFGYVGSVAVHTLHHYVELSRERVPTSRDPVSERRAIRRRALVLAALLAFHGGLWLRVAIAGDLALVAVLTIPVAAFSARLIVYGRRYRAIRTVPQPA